MEEDETCSKISRHPHSTPCSSKPQTYTPTLLFLPQTSVAEKTRNFDSTQSLLLPGVPGEPEAKPQLELKCAAGSPANPRAPSHLAHSSGSAALAAGTACQQGLSFAFHSAEVCLIERSKRCTLWLWFSK